jgi:Flp pilus assembly protein TadD
MEVFMKKLSLLATLLLTLEAPALTADNCEIAWQVAEQAATSFAKDQAAGLKLFIQAQQFCPEDAGLNYNLGMAYAEYGRAVDALPLLERAVQGKEATAIWRNNLAAVLLQTGVDSREALSLAKEAAGKESANAEMQLTLIDVLGATGDTYVRTDKIFRRCHFC